MASKEYISLKWEQRPNYKLNIFEVDKRIFENEDYCRKEFFELLCGQNFQCPDCEKRDGWLYLSKRRCYTCRYCKRHLHPLSVSIFRNRKISPLKLFKILNNFDPRMTNAELSRLIKVNPRTASGYLNFIRPIFVAFERKYLDALYARSMREANFHHEFLLWWHEFFFLSALDGKYEKFRGRKAPSDRYGSDPGAYFLRNLPF